jgi:diguanylate cyclase (GGDEF)-like protein
MSGGSFILAINLAVGGLIAAAFASIAIYERARPAALWMAAAYVIGAGYFAAEAAIHVFNGGRFSVAGSVAILLAGMAAFNLGLARKYGNAFSPRLLVAAIVAGTVLVFCVENLERHGLVRMLGYQIPFFVMQALAASIVFNAQHRRGADNLLGALLALSALQFLTKPFIAHAVGGWGADPQAYLSSDYALISQSMSTVSAMAVALMTIFILFRDVLAEATAKSEVDTLSGLLNRNGFQLRANVALQQGLRDGRSISLVICDLDHFKSINDTLGHSSGDRVISAFAAFLGAAAGPGNVSGRIGGEEFAVLLPGSNLASGKLFAEGIRSAFSAMPVAGLPAELRFTASFGVAELKSGEELAELMLRADEALYIAKRDGRDRVRATPDVEKREQPRLRIVRD